MGWRAIKNGDLLALAAQNFEIFVTVDQNLPAQQNIRALPIAVIVIQASTNRIADLLPAVPNLLKAIEFANPGAVTLVSA